MLKPGFRRVSSIIGIFAYQSALTLILSPSVICLKNSLFQSFRDELSFINGSTSSLACS